MQNESGRNLNSNPEKIQQYKSHMNISVAIQGQLKTIKVSASGLTTHSKNRATWLLSLSWLKGEVRENLGNFRKSIQILTFLSPLPHVPLSFTKTNVLHYDLKKDAINEFGIKYWTSTSVWVTFQEHGSSFYMNIEEKVWLLVEKIRTWKDWLKLRFLTEIGRFHWNQGEEVAHFTWFGEPWSALISCTCIASICHVYMKFPLKIRFNFFTYSFGKI